MIRFSILGMCAVLLGGCVSTKTTPALEFGRQVAALKVTASEVPNHLRSQKASTIYTVTVCLWDERMPNNQDDLSVRSQEARWIKTNMGGKIAPGFVADVLSAPQVVLEPNQWRSMEAVQRIGGTVAEMKFRVDGELVSVGCYPGVTLKAFVEALEGERVHVKGAMVVAKLSPSGTLYHAFPFDLGVKLGEPEQVYERGMRQGIK